MGAEPSSSVPPASAASLSLGRMQLRATVIAWAPPRRIRPATASARRCSVEVAAANRLSSEPSPLSAVAGASPLSGGSLSAAVAAELASAAGIRRRPRGARAVRRRQGSAKRVGLARSYRRGRLWRLPVSGGSSVTEDP